jgi:acetyl esterase/lipase
MRREVLLSIVALAIFIAPSASPWQARAEENGAVTLRLWPGTAPGAASSAATTAAETRDFPAKAWIAGKPVMILGNVSQPALTFYPPRTQGDDRAPANGYPVVIVFPGGGYNILAYDLEGTEVCDWLNGIGVACALLKYRVPNTGPYPKSDAALQDAQRAVGLVRQHASEWKIDPKRAGVLGFSAGGHLAAALTSHSAARLYPPVDAADGLSCRPDFQLLIYPAYLSETDGSLDLAAAVQPPADAPPTFLVQAEDDPIHVENALAYFEALKRKDISAEMHLYAKGGHGYGLRPTLLPVSGWKTHAALWLESTGIVPKAQ